MLLLATAAFADDTEPTREHELERLLLQDCGSCHGLRLTGGLGPAITQARMRTRPLAWIKQVIAEGVPGTPMPPWKNLLSGTDIGWLARRLREGKDSAP